MSASLSLVRAVGASVLMFAAAAVEAESYVLTTLAGTPSQGFADGVGTLARFAVPQAVAFGPDGNAYVADYNNGVVRKLTPGGTVTTLAGAPRAFGYVDGPASSARFLAIFGIAVDTARNVYVAESSAATIRKITPDGTVLTIAGTAGLTGSADGIGAAARFGDPRGLAVDRAGNVYVGDIANNSVRKIAPDGTVTTLAGLAGSQGSADGTGPTARFGSPYGVATDAAGNVYVADWLNSNIRKITADGVVTTVAGLAGTYGAADGTGAAARFDSPDAIAVDPTGNLYVSDRATHTIRLVAAGGVVTTIAGQAYLRGYTDGRTSDARFNEPTGVAVDPAGYLYIADTYNCTIRRMDTAGNVVTVAGRCGGGTSDGARSAARFFTPQGVAIDSTGTLYIADTYNHTVRKMAPDGTVTTVAGLGGAQGSVDGNGTDARFRYPQNLTLDAAGNIYVSDYSNQTIRKITPAGLVSTLAGLVRTTGSQDGSGTAARFDSPADIKIDGAGNLFVADSGNHTIRRVAPDGHVTTVAGKAGTAGNTDGPALFARFNSPWGLAFDAAGNMYIADSGNHVIRKLTPDGTVSTLAGMAGSSGWVDGRGADARFNSPASVAVDPDGNIFVSDAGNHLIRKTTASGAVTTIAGSGYAGFGDGIADAAELFYPAGIASDAFGNIYVADQANQAIRKAGLTGVAVPASRLFNLAVRANLAATQPFTAGFVLTGDAKPILLRAVGPGLAPYVDGVTTASNPRLELYDGASTLMQTNEDWGGTQALRDAFGRVGAFPLPNNSVDAALLTPISGLHTVHVLTPASGVAVVEAYDSGDGTGSRLINVSARYQVNSGAGALFAGFVIIGSSPKTVLVRGIGPGLAGYGVGNFLRDPKVTLYLRNAAGTDVPIADNDDWPASIATTFDKVGAFGLTGGSKDAALLISLSPGVYSTQLAGADGGTGEGLIEVYEVGN